MVSFHQVSWFFFPSKQRKLWLCFKTFSVHLASCDDFSPSVLIKAMIWPIVTYSATIIVLMHYFSYFIMFQPFFRKKMSQYDSLILAYDFPFNLLENLESRHLTFKSFFWKKISKSFLLKDWHTYYGEIFAWVDWEMPWLILDLILLNSRVDQERNLAELI